MIVWSIVSAIRPEASCFDNRRNQNETGVDCGGVCGACRVSAQAQSLKIDESYVIDGVDGRVDAVTKITNPNHALGASRVRYALQLKDAQGNIVGERIGATFILPAETKYILEPGITILDGAQVASADFSIKDVSWEGFDGYQEPRIVVLNKAYTVINTDTVYSRVTGLVRNESEFDFASIRVNVVLKDDSGAPIAIHRTRLDAMDSGMERDFSLPWPHSFLGEVSEVEIDVEANIFDVENFRKKYMSGPASGGR